MANLNKSNSNRSGMIRPANNTLALIALVISIIAIVFSFLPDDVIVIPNPVLGFILALIGFSCAARSRGLEEGEEDFDEEDMDLGDPKLPLLAKIAGIIAIAAFFVSGIKIIGLIGKACGCNFGCGCK